MSSRTASKLVVNSSRLVTFRPQNVQSTCVQYCGSFLFTFYCVPFKYGWIIGVINGAFHLCHHNRVPTQFNIRTTTRHICRNCYGTQATRHGNNFRLIAVIFCIQYFMLNSTLFEQPRNQSRLLNRCCPYQNRLTIFIAFNQIVHDRFEFLTHSFINDVVVIQTGNGFVCWNNHNVQIVDFSKFFFLSFSSTGHTCQLVIHSEIILIRNGSIRLRFRLNLYLFFGFDGLMQTV